MSIESRLAKLERWREEGDGRVRFRVIVPPKMSREEWQRHCREMGRTGARVFTVDFDGAGRGGGEDE